MSMSAPKRRKLSGEEPSCGKTTADVSRSGTARSSRTQSRFESKMPVSNMQHDRFQFQLEELLSHLRPTQKLPSKSTETVLQQLKDTIENIPEGAPRSVEAAELDLRQRAGVAIPLPEPGPQNDIKFMLEYARPAEINVVGSYALKSISNDRRPLVVDLAITIPSSILQKNDFLDNRYFYKRAFYIAYLAAALTQEPKYEVTYCYQDDDRSRPTILVVPIEKTSNKNDPRLTIRIITTIDPNIFPISQSTPFSHTRRPATPAVRGPLTLKSSFTSILRSESSVLSYAKTLHDTASTCSSFRDACLLGRVWLRQRGFGSAVGQGGFGHFEWSILIALLLRTGLSSKKPLLSTTYSPYQLFRAVIQFLSARDLTTPLVLFEDGRRNTESSQGYPILFDSSQDLNLLFKMTPWSYSLLRHEATMTLQMLNASDLTKFDNIFVYRVDYPLCQFDECITLNLARTHSPRPVKSSCLPSIYGVLSRALGDRAKLIHLNENGGDRRWSVQLSQDEHYSGNVEVGLLLDPKNLHRTVDRGPLAEDSNGCKAFRVFWGDKAELRRFKDGVIAESLVWSQGQDEDEPPVHQLITYILCRHFDLRKDDIMFSALNPNTFSSIQHLMKPAIPFESITSAFNTLENKLRNLDGLPLEFHHLFPASPILRQTSAPRDHREPLEPVDVILQFEGSTRWPNDLVAIQMTKLSFLIKIKELLEHEDDIIFCKVGLESYHGRIQNIAFLDIGVAFEITFRVRIYYEDEEIHLLEKLRSISSVGQGRNELVSAITSHRRLFRHQIQHTQMVQNLATRFPLLSPTIRLFKFWVGSHLVESHFCEETLELLVCYVFLNPHSWSTPLSLGKGLLHSLDLLSKWDWLHEPLVLDPSEMTRSDKDHMNTNFASWRKIDPLMNTVSLVVASPVDLDGITWTQQAKPPKVIASRISALAKAAMCRARKMGTDLSYSDLFKSSLKDYDFLLHLRNRKANSRQSLRKHSRDSPVCHAVHVEALLSELDRRYGNDVLFFHGGEPKVIAGLWKPNISQPRPFSLKAARSRKPTTSQGTSGDSVILNKDATLCEIASLGGNLLEGIARLT